MQAIEQLQALLHHSHHYDVAFDRKGRYSSRQFRHDLSRCMASLQSRRAQSYFLFAENSYEFAVNFWALILLNKDIVLTANNQPEWLDSIDQAFDGVISDQPGNNQLCSTHFNSEDSNLDQPPVTVPETLTSQIRFYTSGSSSEPKAINKTIRQLLLEVDTLETIFASQVTDCLFLASVSHHHIYGLIFRLLWPLLYRRTFYAEIILYPEQLVQLYRQQSEICLISSPAFLSRQDQTLEKINLKQCFSSGSLLPAQAADASYQQLGVYPIEVFGSTETGGIGYRSQQNNNTAWTLFPGVKLELVEHGRASLSSPYLEQPQLLDDKIELISGTQFNLLGRIDRVVKIEEKRVSLNAIEAALKDALWVQDAKIIVLQQQRTFLAAVIELSDDGRAFLQQDSRHALNQKLKSLLKTKFEAVSIPRKWRYLEQLPYNSQGKLPIATLVELF